MTEVSAEAQIQGSDAWHKHRSRHANASEAAAVMNRSRFFPRNQHELWLVKTGRETVTETAPMRRGTQFEAEARAWLEEYLDETLEPYVLTRTMDGVPFSASLDGRPFASNRPHEIKVPRDTNSMVWKVALDGRIPEYYQDQLDHQLLVADEDLAIFCVYSPEEQHGLVLTYQRDHKRIETLRKAWTEFWPYVAEDREPPRPVAVRKEAGWRAAAKAYIAAKRSLDLAAENERAARERLIALAGDAPAEGAGVRVMPFERAGSVDWKAFAKDKGLDESEAEAYRKESPVSWRISIDKYAL